MSSLQRCLNPSSIAVIGGREAARVIEQCQKFGFDGPIHAVHPSQAELAGIQCITDAAELTQTVDAAFVAIPATPTIDTVATLNQQKAGGVVCYASGFGEVGNVAGHDQLLSAAADMPLIGPNCYGYINALNGAVLWPDQHGLSRVEEGVAIFSGSGNLCVNISMQKRGLPVALLVSVGNQALVGLEECLEVAIDDDRITAIGLHIEGIKNLPKFCEQAARASACGKPIVALKTGKSEMGARIAMSHTASLAGSAELFDCLFDRLGIAQVSNLETFLETLKLLSISGPMQGNRLLSLSCSGGEASLVADLTQTMNIELPEFTDAQASDVQSTLNDLVTVSNPFDYHTFIWGDYDRLYATFAEALKIDVDLAILLLDIPNIDGCDINDWIKAADAFVDACKANEKSGAIVSCLAESMPIDIIERLKINNITPLLGLHHALEAIDASTRIQDQTNTVAINTVAPLSADNQKTLDELEAKEVLSLHGLRVPAHTKVSSVDAAIHAAAEIGYPIAIKIVGVAHKTEVDGVRLNIQTEDQLRAAAQQLLDSSDELLVEEMVTDSICELLIGVNYDDQFGHHLILGYGGTLVELIRDRQILLLPASDEDIIAAIRKLKTSSLLFGYRGKPEANLDAIVAAVRSVLQYVEKQRASLLEIDINPLIVTESEAIAADALIVKRS